MIFNKKKKKKNKIFFLKTEVTQNFNYFVKFL